MNQVIDADEETPDWDTIKHAQNTYEELLEELDRFQVADIQGADVDEELDMIKNDIRDTRAYLKVETEYLEPENFLIGPYNEEHVDTAEDFYGPKTEQLQRSFESAEKYYQELKERF